MSAPDPSKMPGWGYGVYEPPQATSGPPSIVLWYRVYALVNALVYGAVAVRSLLRADGHSDDQFILLVCSVLALAYLAAAFIPLSPRGWTVGLVAIAFGLVFCLFPAAAVLLVIWCRPVTKAAFRRL